MNVLYATDENYVRHAAAGMLSLMDSNRQAEALTIHVLSMGVSPDSRAALERLVSQRERSIAFYELGDIRRWLDFDFNARGFASSTLARLFLARVLPEDVERVLYLDCDTVVLEDLSPLFALDMTGFDLGMVAEPTANKARRAGLGMPVEQPYFNAGVMLVNLRKWRADGAEKTILDYYKAKGGNLVAPDQDAINGALPGRILELPPRYNYGSVQLYYSWKAQRRIAAPTPFMDEEAYRRGTEKPAIVHFLGEERPWRAGNRHPYTPVYDRYLAMTPWADTPKEEGWRAYYRCFSLFNAVTRPVPMVRYRVIDALIPAFMRMREKKLAAGKRQGGHEK